MSSISAFPHRCEAWKPENFTNPETPSPHPEFFIQIFAEFESTDEDGQRVTSPTTYKEFTIQRDLLITGTTSWSMISNILSQMDVPYNVQPFIIQKISTLARDIAGSDNTSCNKTIPMVVTVTVVQGFQESIMDASSWVCGTRLVGASESSVEALEKVKVVEGFFTTHQCVICLEDILMGSEATRMPCSHVYHGDCIVNWLKKSNLCPLCRFQMPVH